MFKLLIIPVFALLFSCQQAQNAKHHNSERSGNASAVLVVGGDTIPKVNKSDDEWKAELSDAEFYVLRKKGTERAFSGDLLENKKTGVYTCAGCGFPLFHSSAKFESGTGWPSFWQPLNKYAVAEESDYSHGMTRVEVLCARCGGHLGHVFPDGPKPSGLRYCINSVSLDFDESE